MAYIGVEVHDGLFHTRLHYVIGTVYFNNSLIRCIIVQVDWGDESPTRVSPWEASFLSRKFHTTHTATTLAGRTTKYLLDLISKAKKTPKFELFVKPVCNTLFIATLDILRITYII